MLSYISILNLDGQEMNFEYTAFEQLLKSIIVYIEMVFQDNFSLELNVIAFPLFFEEFVCDLNLKLNYELIQQCQIKEDNIVDIRANLCYQFLFEPLYVLL